MINKNNPHIILYISEIGLEKSKDCIQVIKNITKHLETSIKIERIHKLFKVFCEKLENHSWLKNDQEICDKLTLIENDASDVLKIMRVFDIAKCEKYPSIAVDSINKRLEEIFNNLISLFKSNRFLANIA